MICLHFEFSNENKELFKYVRNFIKKPLYVNMAISTILCFESTTFLILKLVHHETNEILLYTFCATLFLIYNTWTWTSFVYELKDNNPNKH